MGRKSRAKAARRAARERGVVVGIDQTIGAAQSDANAPQTTTQVEWSPSKLEPLAAPPSHRRPVPAPVVRSPPTARPELSMPSDCDRLSLLAAELAEAQRAVENGVLCQLRRGHSWTDIGRALGVSRQGARQRYGRLLAADYTSKKLP